ncbi:hypothetical protein [Bartonella sp. A05]|uniref:hypothetical protein n=1 Tax=Bartonella sp. A05 TaxID=2967261 RepID=UPI0022A8E6CF|nr:hypothetical protein [Bartonella sp. A05]MCZ2203727.1 hypothetical protein [Bartonella sp. A05]
MRMFLKQIFLALMAVILITEISHAQDDEKEDFVIGNVVLVQAFASSNCLIEIKEYKSGEKMVGAWNCDTISGQNVMNMARIALTEKTFIKVYYDNPKTLNGMPGFRVKSIVSVNNRIEETSIH